MSVFYNPADCQIKLATIIASDIICHFQVAIANLTKFDFTHKKHYYIIETMVRGGKKMFQYNRLNELLTLINHNDYITCARLADSLNISERTVRTDIQNINDVLDNHGATIKIKRKHGYYLEISEKPAYELFLTQLEDQHETHVELDSTQDRVKYALGVLIYSNDYLDLDELADQICVSRITLNNYIRSIKVILNNYDLEYIAKTGHGVKIIGLESNKRKCLIENVISQDFQNYVMGFTKDEYTLFAGIDLDYLRETVITHLNGRIDRISDYNLKNLVIHFALMISRVINDNYITSDRSLEIPEDVKADIDRICNNLEDYYQISISNGEKKYIYMHMVANISSSDSPVSDHQLKDYVAELLSHVYLDYNFDLRNDEILINDLQKHFQSIITTKTYSLDRRNPLLNTIKNNFPLAFEISLTATAKVFGQSHFSLNEDEVGYVSLHIGAAIERCFSGSIAKKSVILVCGSGQATTRMLEARLNVYFKEKIFICRKASYNEFLAYTKREVRNIDFIISTIPLKSDIIPAITVDFALKNNDIEAITKLIASISNDTMQKAQRFFDKELFLRIKSYSSKEKLLRDMCVKLKTCGCVDDDFYACVMKREHLANTNMNEVFALPHPMEVIALNTKVAVAILDEPLAWNDSDNVQIIFML